MEIYEKENILFHWYNTNTNHIPYIPPVWCNLLSMCFYVNFIGVKVIFVLSLKSENALTLSASIYAYELYNMVRNTVTTEAKVQ